MPLDLRPSQALELEKALIDAFDKPSQVETMLMKLDIDPKDLDLSAEWTICCRQLVKWFDRQSRSDELIAVAIQENATNSKLKRLGVLFAYTSAKEPDRRYESLLSEYFPQSITEFRERMDRALRSVGRIETPSGRAIGTGFLLGPDLLLTNYHVVKDITNGGSGAAKDWAVQFSSQRVGFADGGVLSYSPHDRDDRLDYALIRLAQSVGEGISIPASRPPDPPALIILQHPRGNDLRIAMGSLVGRREGPPRIDYTVDTDDGSSGSPVFTSNWDLYGLHNAGGKLSNGGIPIDALRDRLDLRNGNHASPVKATATAPPAKLESIASPLRRQRPAFEQTSRRLKQIHDLKRMHDALHKKQLEHKRLKSLVASFPAGYSAQEVKQRALDWPFDQDELFDLARKPGVGSLLGISFEDEIREVGAALIRANAGKSIPDLQDTVELLDRVLGQAMPRLDGAIAQAAADLDLSVVANACGQLPPTSDGRRLTSAEILTLQDTVEERVRTHGIWQMIDDDLRRFRFLLQQVESVAVGDRHQWIARHRVHFDRLFRKLDRIATSATSDADLRWAKPLAEARVNVESAIPSCDLERIRNESLTLETICDRRFKAADDNLLRTCAQVQELSEEIDRWLDA